MAMSEQQREQLRAMRAAMDESVKAAAEKGAAAVNEVSALVRAWKPAAYAVGDVRFFGGAPYKCVQAHDSTQNSAWTPAAAPALWMQYHGTTQSMARAWVAPTGAQDMYLAGEWMIYTDGVTYECLSDTTYSPTDYAAAWRAAE